MKMQLIYFLKMITPHTATVNILRLEFVLYQTPNGALQNIEITQHLPLIHTCRYTWSQCLKTFRERDRHRHTRRIILWDVKQNFDQNETLHVCLAMQLEQGWKYQEFPRGEVLIAKLSTALCKNICSFLNVHVTPTNLVFYKDFIQQTQINT